MAMPGLSKLPKFLRRTSTWVIIAIIAFFVFSHNMKYLPTTAVDTSKGPLDTTGVKAAAIPQDKQQDVIDWANNSVQVIMTFDSDNADLHFQQNLSSYFTDRGRAVFAQALASSGTVQYVKGNCRSEGLSPKGAASVHDFGTRDGNNIWTVYLPVTLMDGPNSGSCRSADGGQHSMDALIAVLVQQKQDDARDMKIDGWAMKPLDEQGQ